MRANSLIDRASDGEVVDSDLPGDGLSRKKKSLGKGGAIPEDTLRVDDEKTTEERCPPPREGHRNRVRWTCFGRQ